MSKVQKELQIMAYTGFSNCIPSVSVGIVILRWCVF